MINSLSEISVATVLVQLGREEYQPEGSYLRERIFLLWHESGPVDVVVVSRGFPLHPERVAEVLFHYQTGLWT